MTFAFLFSEELPTVAFKCSTQQQSERLGRRKASINNSAASKNSLSDESSALQSSTCLGADTLIQMLKNYCRNSGMKTAITVGVVGLPNVGKSSLINSLKRSKVAQVGNTPGVTKSLQEVHLDKNIKLLDSPGIVFADADSDSSAVLRNCVKIEKLVDPIAPIAEILKRVPSKQLMQLYKISSFKDADQFLQHVAHVRGKLRKGGTPDMQASARVVLQDWNDGRIPYFTSPPSRGNEEHAAAEVVDRWSKEFDAELVFANEKSAVIAHLAPMEEGEEGGAGGAGKDKRAFFQLESMGGAKVDLTAMDEDLDKEDDEGDEEDEEDEDEEGDAMEDADDEEYGAPSAKRAKVGVLAGGAKSGAALLYSEVGQLDPAKARKERKAAKKKEGKEELVAAAVARKIKKVEEEEDFDFNQTNDEEEDEDDEEGEEGEEEEEDEEDEDDDDMEQ